MTKKAAFICSIALFLFISSLYSQEIGIQRKLKEILITIEGQCFSGELQKRFDLVRTDSNCPIIENSRIYYWGNWIITKEPFLYDGIIVNPEDGENWKDGWKAIYSFEFWHLYAFISDDLTEFRGLGVIIE